MTKTTTETDTDETWIVEEREFTTTNRLYIHAKGRENPHFRTGYTCLAKLVSGDREDLELMAAAPELRDALLVILKDPNIEIDPEADKQALQALEKAGVDNL